MDDLNLLFQCTDTCCAVAKTAADSVQMLDKAAIARSTSYALQSALFTWLMTGIIGMGVAMIMKVLYLHMKSKRIKSENAELAQMK